MEKILLVGPFCEVVRSLNESLTDKYNVQLCTDSMEMVEGIIKITRPDLVMLYIKEKEEFNPDVLDYLKEYCANIPVLMLGDMDTKDYFSKYFKNGQFAFLGRPITKEVLLDKCHSVIKKHPTDDEEQAVSEAADVIRKHVLVVDDSGLALRSVKALLDGTYQVSVATSGEQALRIIKKKHPDVILLDYEMPEWDGRKTLEMIRQDDEIKDIPVIFLTGVADKEHIAAVLGLNPAGYLLKPPDREKLFNLIEETLK